jgi:hypothetical protein
MQAQKSSTKLLVLVLLPPRPIFNAQDVRFSFLTTRDRNEHRCTSFSIGMLGDLLQLDSVSRNPPTKRNNQ